MDAQPRQAQFIVKWPHGIKPAAVLGNRQHRGALIADRRLQTVQRRHFLHGADAAELMADRRTVAEGAFTAPVLARLASERGVDMPIVAEGVDALKVLAYHAGTGKLLAISILGALADATPSSALTLLTSR